MEQRQSDVLGHVDALLAEGYRMWDSFGLIKLSEAEKHEIPQAAALACRTEARSMPPPASVFTCFADCIIRRKRCRRRQRFWGIIFSVSFLII